MAIFLCIIVMMKIKSILKDFIQVLLMSFVLVFILLKFIFMPCVVEGTSMNPILKDNDFGYSFIIARNIKINRFDIAVIQVNNQANDKLLVKRVIGLPNEKVTYKNNRLYINDELIDEYFLNDDVYTNDFEMVLGENEYCCLGDNRGVSRDSRSYGAFKEDSILSTHLFIVYPFSDFGFK